MNKLEKYKWFISILILLISGSSYSQTSSIEHKGFPIYFGNNCINYGVNGDISKPCLKITTWNLLAQYHDVEEASGQKAWSARRADAVDHIMSEGPDIIGFQEVSDEKRSNRPQSQFDDLRLALASKYNLCAGLVTPWYRVMNPIFVKKGVGHSCSQAYYPRGDPHRLSCNSVIVKGIRVINCHLNWRTEINLSAARELVAKHSGRYVLIGDLNTAENHYLAPASYPILSAEIDMFPSSGSGTIDKIGVHKVQGLCVSNGTQHDYIARELHASDHPSVTAIVSDCR